MTKCRMCNSDTLSTVFGGPIRDGGVGASTVDDYKIIKCEHCKLVQITPVPKQLDSFYESHEYRSNWDANYDPSDIHKKYDHEQNERISRIGVQNIRNATILDLGCSAGIFLDTVQSLAEKTIAVEPFEYYSRYLKERGHTYYPYPQDAINQGESADIVTSFDVIEHIEQPKDFINSAFKLLKPGGGACLVNAKFE
jgi:2-polyprenyl-3-methyl-5-hydroxy-6-metoxy-1,4-benzoquinol methylase